MRYLDSLRLDDGRFALRQHPADLLGHELIWKTGLGEETNRNPASFAPFECPGSAVSRERDDRDAAGAVVPLSSLRVASQPSMTGSDRSMMMSRAGAPGRVDRPPCRCAPRITSYPEKLRYSEYISRLSAKSSTTSTNGLRGLSLTCAPPCAE